MTEKSHSVGGASDLTFIMNETGQSLRDRLAILFGKDTDYFVCLVGYFFISGFYGLCRLFDLTPDKIAHIEKSLAKTGSADSRN